MNSAWYCIWSERIVQRNSNYAERLATCTHDMYYIIDVLINNNVLYIMDSELVKITSLSCPLHSSFILSSVNCSKKLVSSHPCPTFVPSGLYPIHAFGLSRIIRIFTAKAAISIGNRL